MYRTFEVKDEAGKKMEFKVYPDLAPPYNELIKVEKHEIDITLETQKCLSSLIATVSKFMGGNTINKLEVKEVAE